MVKDNIAERDVVGMENNQLMKWQSKNIVSAVALSSLSFIIFLISACQTIPQTADGFPTPEKSPTEDSIARAKENQMKQNKINLGILAENRRLWTEKNINHYKMTVTAREGGNFQYQQFIKIEVQDNQIVSTIFNKKPGEQDTEIYQRIGTVEKQFDLIQQELDKGGAVWIKYNKDFGYPENMAVEYHGDGDYVIQQTDKSINVEISKFEIIPQ